MAKDLSTKSLKQLKHIVDRTMDATLECGQALREIRDRKLYLEECGSFQEFVETNWHISKPRAYQLIDYVEIVEKLPTETSTAVDSGRAIRELKKVPEEQRVEVAQRAIETSGRLTTESVAQAARSMTADSNEVLDKTDFVIPEGSPAMATWQRASEANDILKALSQIKGILTRALEGKDKMYCEVNFSAAIADLTSSYQLLKVCVPYAVCPTCQGRVLNECATCKCRGMVSEFYWKYKVPDETRKIREKAVALRRGKK